MLSVSCTHLLNINNVPVPVGPKGHNGVLKLKRQLRTQVEVLNATWNALPSAHLTFLTISEAKMWIWCKTWQVTTIWLISPSKSVFHKGNMLIQIVQYVAIMLVNLMVYLFLFWWIFLLHSKYKKKMPQFSVDYIVILKRRMYPGSPCIDERRKPRLRV